MGGLIGLLFIFGVFIGFPLWFWYKMTGGSVKSDIQRTTGGKVSTRTAILMNTALTQGNRLRAAQLREADQRRMNYVSEAEREAKQSSLDIARASEERNRVQQEAGRRQIEQFQRESDERSRRIIQDANPSNF